MDRNYFNLEGQVALVTGCSGGLGVQMAKALAFQGANIVAVARRMDKLEAVCAEIVEEFGVKALPVQCDITSTEAVEAAVDAALAELAASISSSTMPAPVPSPPPRTSPTSSLATRWRSTSSAPSEWPAPAPRRP